MFRKKGKLAALLAAVLTLTLAQTEFLQIYATETNEETSGRAAGDIAVDSAHFPDPAFLAEIERLDNDGDKILSAAEIQAITSLSFSRDAGISSLQGIEYLTALETLHVPGNNLTELDVSKNTNLVSLTCDGNSITALTLGTNTNLTVLNCSFNLLSVLELSGVPNLTTLDCGDNADLTSLDVSHNPNLKTLNCSGNNMTSLEISSNGELTSLDCSFNNLTELNVTSCEKLELLHCQYNALTSLDLTNNPLLTNVDVSVNKLTSLNLDNNTVLTEANFTGGAQSVSLGNIPGSSYDLSSFDANIDGNKITNASGATFQGAVMSGYQNGTPVTYEYLCSVQGLKLGVTLNFNAQDMNSSITYMDGSAEFSSWTTDYAGQQPTSYVEGTSVQLPTAENVAKEGYTFAGWYKDADFTGSPVTEISATDKGPHTLYAKFEINAYQVTFQDMNGNLIGTAQTVEHGQSAVAPQAPVVDGYRFTGWSADFSNVTGPLTVTATYTANQYTVTFVDWNGTVLETQTVAHGSAAAPTVTPSRAGYKFISWDTAFTNVTGNLTVTAQYEAVPAPVQASPVTAVKTGDQSSIIPLLAVAGAVLVLAVGAAAYRYIHKKKK